MLKKRDLQEVPQLFELSIHPEVYPYIRHKADTSDAFYFLTKKLIESEHEGELISRTILDEYEQPMGTINLYDIHGNSGFLATWIGKEYFGQGYNEPAKQAFFNELFYQLEIETIFMKIRVTNERSLRAVAKLDYVIHANTIYQEVFESINAKEYVYELFAITKEHYTSYLQFSQQTENTEEGVS